MTKVLSLALCSALAIAPEGEDGVPEWINLLPAGGEVKTHDGRGPYKATNLEALMAASLPAGEKLVLDENHSTDLAAPKGGEAPARGWIVALEEREGSVWGKVDWTPEGRKRVADKEYRGISPVISYRKDGTIVAIRRASLVNKPNLAGLVALHAEETSMDFRNQLVAALGLGEDAGDEAILAAVKKACGATETAVQSALSPILDKLGVEAVDDVDAAIEALQAEKGEPDDATIEGLQAELTEVATELQQMREDRTREKAEAFVDGAIAEGRVGVKPMRDDYVAMHMENPARTEKLINAKPALKPKAPGGGRTATARSTDLDDADRSVIALMGLDPEQFKKTRAAELGETEEAL